MKTIALWPSWARNIETVHLYLPNCIYTGHTHGPTKFPWWKIFSVDPVRCTMYAPSICWNIWVYTRWHRAVVFELSVGRGLSRVDPWPRMQPFQIAALTSKLKAARKLSQTL